MNASIKGLCAKALPQITPRVAQTDAQLGSVVVYACGNAAYTFTHTAETGITATFTKT
jgi:hypothetical protein